MYVWHFLAIQRLILMSVFRMMFSLESIDGMLMWQFANYNTKEATLVDPDTLEPNAAGDTYIR